MARLGRVLFFGVLTWAIPFAVSVAIFTFKTTNRALFESLMAVTVTATVVTFTILDLQKLSEEFLTEGLLLGVIWFALNIGIDLALFMEGPMKMSFLDYMADIGVTYLIIPIVTVGIGFILERQVHRRPI